jgi:hypothetical protein
MDHGATVLEDRKAIADDDAPLPPLIEDDGIAFTHRDTVLLRGDDRTRNVLLSDHGDILCYANERRAERPKQRHDYSHGTWEETA